jgi:hypothetical protein
MRLFSLTLCISLVALTFAAFTSSAAAQPKEKPKPKDKNKGTVTDIAQADEDYAFQGEYTGAAFRPGLGNEYVGLQVVALGGGKFAAVRYRGGLPGAGWDGATKDQLSGERSGPGVTLAGPEQKIEIAAGGSMATVFGPNDQILGRLNKVHRGSPTMGAPPPPGAVVLFNGTNTDQFIGGKMTTDGLLQAGALTKMPVEDFRLHLEFRTPYKPAARGQARGNSGVYIQQRYEVQVLDSFGLEGVENECGGLYRQTRPDVNMAYPPLAWQTYDIYFTAARFSPDGKTKVSPARITVLQNGVPVHLHRDISNKTGGGKAEGPQPLPINLQDHGNPVAFRNIWIIPGQGDWAYGNGGGYGGYAGGYGGSTVGYASGCYSASCCNPCCGRRHRLFHRRCR